MLIPTRCTVCSSKKVQKNGFCTRCESVFYRLLYYFWPSLVYPVYKDFGSVLVAVKSSDLVLTFGGARSIPWFEKRLLLSTVQVTSSLKLVYDTCLAVAELLPKICSHQDQVCRFCRPTLVEFLRVFKPRSVWLYGYNNVFLVFCDSKQQARWLLRTGFRRTKFLQVDWNTESDQFTVSFDSLAKMLQCIFDICLRRASFFEERLKKYFNPKYGTEG